MVGKLTGTSSYPDGDVHELEGNTTVVDAEVIQLDNQININMNGDLSVPPTVDTDNIIRLSDKNSLIWVKVDLNNQTLPSMIDSGANPNCISMRCVQGSPHLRQLERSPE